MTLNLKELDRLERAATAAFLHGGLDHLALGRLVECYRPFLELVNQMGEALEGSVCAACHCYSDFCECEAFLSGGKMKAALAAYREAKGEK